MEEVALRVCVCVKWGGCWGQAWRDLGGPRGHSYSCGVEHRAKMATDPHAGWRALLGAHRPPTA